MPRINQYSLGRVLLVLCLTANVWAEEGALPTTEQALDGAELLAEELPLKENTLDSSRDWLADKIENFSSGLDIFLVERFFSDEIIEDDVNGSRGVLAFHTRREFGGELKYALDAKLKLELPNTNKRLKLIIATEDDSEYSIDKKPIQNIENQTYTTGLRFLINERSAWKSDIDVGLRGGLPLNPFSRVRLRRQGTIGSWNNRLTQNLYYTHLEGWGEKSELRFDHPIGNDKLLVFDNSADYLLANDYFEIQTRLTLYQQLTHKRIWAYQLGASGDTDTGAVLTQYFAGIKFRRLIYKDWIFATLNPQIEWNEDREYRRLWVVMLSLEAVISK